VNSLLRSLKKIVPERSLLRLAWHNAKAFCAALRYGFPALKLIIIGVTGTDGKTTTVSMIAHILKLTGKKVGMVSTTSFCIGDVVELNVTQKTSMSPFILQKMLRRMVNAGCAFAVIEVSSHGLVQGRVNHIFPRVAAITNTAEEHLDYHKTMEQYRRDKGKLFHMLRGGNIKVLNGNDPTLDEYRSIPSDETIIYGMTSGNYWLTDEVATALGSRALLHTDLGGCVELELSVPGFFNLQNALCAICCASALQIPLDECVQALASFKGVSGRLEEIETGATFRVFIDFTVTPQAYERVLSTLRTIPGCKRVLVLFGSCGNRMPEKRPLIGKICSDHADVLVVTSDETYGEPHEKIMDELWSGIDQNNAVAFKVPDRREAIEFILAQAMEGDIVLLAGMAGVTTMMTANGQIPWNEGEIAKELLRSIHPS